MSVSEKVQLLCEPEGEICSLFDLFYSHGNDNDPRHLFMRLNLNVGSLDGKLSPPLLATAKHDQSCAVIFSHNLSILLVWYTSRTGVSIYLA